MEQKKNMSCKFESCHIDRAFNQTKAGKGQGDNDKTLGIIVAWLLRQRTK